MKRRDRSTSPLPNIQRALFKCEANKAAVQPSRKRSSRPSLEDDLRKASSSPLLGPENDKENPNVPRRLSSKVSKSSFSSPSPRGLSTRDANHVFRFSTSHLANTSSPPPPSPYSRVPRIYVQGDEDDVFDPNIPPAPPASSKLLLTPSTAHTPRFHYSSTSYLSSLIPSPNIELGLCCNTPNRLRLEEDGLGSNKFVLGRGAYGTVVLGQWKGRKVAIKLMEKEEGGKSARRRKSLESELQARNLEHENIVKVFGVHAADDRHTVIIMEYVGSRNLHRLLVELKDKSLGSSWLLKAAQQVSSALAHCHSRGVLHMDIKPANILVSSQGVCKVGDFGCSVSTSCTSLTLAHSLVGTPGYQAPEFLQPRCFNVAAGLQGGSLQWSASTDSHVQSCLSWSQAHPTTSTHIVHQQSLFHQPILFLLEYEPNQQAHRPAGCGFHYQDCRFQRGQIQIENAHDAVTMSTA